jgi:predicted O-methyltransferase YrrM
MASARVTPPPPAEQLQHFPRLAGRPFHPTSWQFPEHLSGSKCRWLAALEDLYQHPMCFPASLSPQAGLLLHSLVQNCRPRVIVEVGMFCSVSTHWIAGALAAGGARPGVDAVVHCFDDFGPIHKGPWREAEMLEGRREFVEERLERAGLLEFVRIHPGDSAPTIRACADELRAAGGVDFAFIDGNHKIHGAVADFLATEPVLNTGAHIVVHDTFPDQCGGHEGPRFILDHVRTLATVDPEEGSEPPARVVKEAVEAARRGEPLGAGVYDRVELYLAPLNYGMGVLRRLR